MLGYDICIIDCFFSSEQLVLLAIPQKFEIHFALNMKFKLIILPYCSKHMPAKNPYFLNKYSNNYNLIF